MVRSCATILTFITIASATCVDIEDLHAATDGNAPSGITCADVVAHDLCHHTVHSYRIDQFCPQSCGKCETTTRRRASGLAHDTVTEACACCMHISGSHSCTFSTCEHGDATDKWCWDPSSDPNSHLDSKCSAADMAAECPYQQPDATHHQAIQRTEFRIDPADWHPYTLEDFQLEYPDDWALRWDQAKVASGDSFHTSKTFHHNGDTLHAAPAGALGGLRLPEASNGEDGPVVVGQRRRAHVTAVKAKARMDAHTTGLLAAIGSIGSAALVVGVIVIGGRHLATSASDDATEPAWVCAEDEVIV